MWFSRQEYWSGLPWPPPANLPNSGIESASLVSYIGGWFLYHQHHLGSPISLRHLWKYYFGVPNLPFASLSENIVGSFKHLYFVDRHDFKIFSKGTLEEQWRENRYWTSRILLSACYCSAVSRTFSSFSKWLFQHLLPALLGSPWLSPAQSQAASLWISRYGISFWIPFAEPQRSSSNNLCWDRGSVSPDIQRAKVTPFPLNIRSGACLWANPLLTSTFRG